MLLTLLVLCLALLLFPWSFGADASVLGRCGGVLSLAVVDSGAVVVDWAFVWRAWCRLVVVVAVCELQKSARASRGIGRGLECWFIICLRQGLVPSAINVAPLISCD